ncbi:hypothetical protein IIQ_05548 [Bacillus cereus VD118]|uniref:Uncharacterized protein n=1 Tax=Bacillus cereus VD118 TaxID=1053231 RepID=R8QWN0_BACCE|nr:hypothetical protein IIQ_05548 [Bacillus cereus VD118]
MKRILILLRQLKEFQSYIFNSVLELHWAQLLHKTRVIKNIFDVKSNKRNHLFRYYKHLSFEYNTADLPLRD